MKKIVFIVVFLIYQNITVQAQGVGTQAPDFSHNTLDHGHISLSDYHGQAVYLFFFGWG